MSKGGRTQTGQGACVCPQPVGCQLGLRQALHVPCEETALPGDGLCCWKSPDVLGYKVCFLGGHSVNSRFL